MAGNKINLFKKGTKKILYRGAWPNENVKSKPTSSWSSSANVALGYGRRKKGSIIKAEITPRTGYLGSDPELTKALGIYDEYIKLRVADKYAEIDKLISKHARKNDIDIQITGTGEIVIFNPRIIRIISNTTIKSKVKISGKSARITPPMPRLR